MYSLVSYIVFFLRPLIKWFLRKTTGLCELQRICYGEISGAPRIKRVENSLNLSRSPQIKQMIKYLNDVSDNQRFDGDSKEIFQSAINTVLLVKKINPTVHGVFLKSFGVCVQQIWGYRQLLSVIEELRKTSYDADNLEHERMLYKLWENLMPNEPLEARITKQWQDIGFQGDDPKTDFRGMGLLGLENLLFFTTQYKSAASYVLSHSLHPVHGYAFAIVGINLTFMAWNLFKNGEAKTYVYNVSKTFPTIRIFHQFYSYLFYEFDKYWVKCKPKSMMEFSNIQEKFQHDIKLTLKDPSTVFRINIPVDTV